MMPSTVSSRPSRSLRWGLMLAMLAGGCARATPPARDGGFDGALERTSNDVPEQPADVAFDAAGDLREDEPRVDTASDAPAETAPLVDTCRASAEALLRGARLPPGFCAWTWASGLATPRGIEVAENGDLLVIERGGPRLTAVFDDDHDFVSGPNERVVLAEGFGLNHGILLVGGFVYASSDTTVFRWPYRTGQRTPLGAPQIVIQKVPGGGHFTRTLAIDTGGRLYVSVGSADDLDADSTRARIRRFSLAIIPPEGIPFVAGELYADGVRNEVGLAFDLQGRLWGVENGSDTLTRTDLGGDIHDDNPAEELNSFEVPGRFYGYPFCWTEYRIATGRGGGPGTQWAYPSALGDGVHSDAWCKMGGNNAPPRFAMPAHVAPLDLVFYRGRSLPPQMRGDAFVTWHGSRYRQPEAGYKVVRVPFTEGQPVGVESLLEFEGPGTRGMEWPHRPVGIREGPDGELYVSSDASGVIIAIGHRSEP